MPERRETRRLAAILTADIVGYSRMMAAKIFRDRISINPTTDLSRAFLVSALGHLEQGDEARRIWCQLMAINPGYSHLDHIARLPFKNPQHGEIFIADLSTAGVTQQP
ncbi:MAG: hypothetical protein V3T62_11395 [Alphaproteobacteria bacterium]